MDAFNTKYFSTKLEPEFEGSKFSVYNRINLLMKGFRGNSTDREIGLLKKALKAEYTRKMKILNNM